MQKDDLFRDALLAVLLTLLARAAYLVVLPASSLSHDLYAWQQVAQVLVGGQNPYAETHLINYPPLWLQCIFVLVRVTMWTGGDGETFLVLVRVLLIACECVCVVLVLMISYRRFQSGTALKWVVVGIALNPVCILLSVQHGNFDVIVGVWVLLFVLCLMDFCAAGETESWLFACLCLGLAILTKTVPFVLLPLLFYRSGRLSRKAKALGGVLALGPVTLGMSVIFALAPAGVSRNVLAYRSIPGFFGITGLVEMIGLSQVNVVYGRLFPILLLVGLVAAGRAFARLRVVLDDQFVILACVLLLLAVPLFGPGYSPQYIYWFLPLLLLLASPDDSRWRPLVRALLLVALATYLVEYALFLSHGAFLIRACGMVGLRPLADALGSRTGQTLVRLPLFAVYLLFFATGCLRLRQAAGWSGSGGSEPADGTTADRPPTPATTE